LDNTVVIEHINKLNKLGGKPELLAQFLDITPEQAKNVQYVKAYYGIDLNNDGIPDYIDFKEKYNPKDTNQVRLPSYIYLKVNVYDETVFADLREGLIKYINSNTYLRNMFDIHRNQTQLMIKEIEVEMEKIDSLQRSRFRKDKQPNAQMIFIGTEPEPRLFHEERLSLFERKQSLERSLEISNEIIVVVQDFTPLSHEENPVLMYLLYFGIAMALLGIICSLLWQYRKKIWKTIIEDSNN